MLHYETIIPETRFVLEALMDKPQLKDYRLVGGTALSLYKGHRKSDDIDLFIDPTKEMNKKEVFETLKTIAESSNHIKISDMGFGYSAYYNYNVRGEEMKIDVFAFESEKFLKEQNVIDGIRLASLDDIVAMKMSAITSRSTKKDFMDIDELSKVYPIKDMVTLYEIRYPYNDKKDAVLALSRIDEADKSEMPKMLNGRTWSNAKENIKTLFREYIHDEAKLNMFKKAILKNDKEMVGEFLKQGVKPDQSHLKLMNEMKSSGRELNPDIEQSIKQNIQTPKNGNKL